jgi:Zn-dependent protease
VNARLKLGRIWTVPIQGAYSLIVLVLLVAGMTAWQFRSSIDGHSIVGYTLAGLFSAVLFIWTVFAHEAAHVVAARHFGARVNGVTLSLRGGETAISGQPASPWQGIVVATSGPVVSAICGVGCGAAAFAAAQLHLPTLVVLSFAWVGILCILLAAANLIPAAPLDGGHVLQAMVWWGTGSRVRASAVSGFAGQIVGATVVGWAIWLALFDLSPIAAAVTAVVGWPLWRGAQATRRVAQQRSQLGGLPVRDVMRDDPRMLLADISVATAAARLADGADGHVAVVDDAGHPCGVLSVERILRAAKTHPERSLGRLVRRGTLVTATPDEPLADLLERTYAKPRPAVVVTDGEATGFIEPADVLAALAHSARTEAPGSSQEPSDIWPGSQRATDSGENRAAA